MTALAAFVIGLAIGSLIEGINRQRDIRALMKHLLSPRIVYTEAPARSEINAGGRDVPSWIAANQSPVIWRADLAAYRVAETLTRLGVDCPTQVARHLLAEYDMTPRQEDA